MYTDNIIHFSRIDDSFIDDDVDIFDYRSRLNLLDCPVCKKTTLKESIRNSSCSVGSVEFDSLIYSMIEEQYGYQLKANLFNVINSTSERIKDHYYYLRIAKAMEFNVVIATELVGYHITQYSRDIFKQACTKFSLLEEDTFYFFHFNSIRENKHELYLVNTDFKSKVTENSYLKIASKCKFERISEVIYQYLKRSF